MAPRNNGVRFQGRRMHVCARVYSLSGYLHPVVGFSVTGDTEGSNLGHLMEIVRKRLLRNQALKEAGVTEITVIGEGISLHEFSKGFDMVVKIKGASFDRVHPVLLEVLNEMLGTERVRAHSGPLIVY